MWPFARPKPEKTDLEAAKAAMTTASAAVEESAKVQRDLLAEFLKDKTKGKEAHG